jgi:hypothetical protein
LLLVEGFFSRARVGWALPLAAFASMASGCTDELEPRGDGELVESDRLRLGRVHVVLEPVESDSWEATESLEVTARFAFVRGLDEEFVRARIDMPVLAHHILRPSDCGISDQLAASSDSDLDSAEARELLLVDAGDLSVRLPDERLEVPLSLMPDLLPYMTGVEYVYYGDHIPTPAHDDAALLVEASGSQNGDLSAFRVEGNIPEPLELSVSDVDLAELADGALVLRWQPGLEDTVTIRLTPLLGDEAVGDELTCVLQDQGASRLDIGKLHALGLPTFADGLRIEASRLSSSTFDAGTFVNAELVVERRDRISVPLR